MIIFFNNEIIEVESEIDIEYFIKNNYFETKGFALALNNSVIPKDDWKKTILSENDKIILIKATCGG